MKCPHCSVTVHNEFRRSLLGDYPKGRWIASQMECPACREMVLTIICGNATPGPRLINSERESLMAYPRGSARAPVPAEVDDAALAEDYREACQVLAISPKAAAALGRRCLQHILREKAKVKPNDLAKEIQEVLDAHTLPTHLAEAIDGVRNIGNFAAHPMKSTTTGLVLPVEPGEAEWTLDTVEALFDFCWVQPARLKAKRDALNGKLTEAGKPAMK